MPKAFARRASANAFLVADLIDEWDRLDARIKSFDTEFLAVARTDPTMRRLSTVPGIGPINATALVAAVGDAGAFGKGRDLAAWLGLVPRQATTGGKPRLLGSASGETAVADPVHGRNSPYPTPAKCCLSRGNQPRLARSSNCVSGGEWSSVADHGVEDDDHLTHDGGDGELWGFSGGAQARVGLAEGAFLGSDRGEDAHVEDVAHLPARPAAQRAGRALRPDWRS